MYKILPLLIRFRGLIKSIPLNRMKKMVTPRQTARIIVRPTSAWIAVVLLYVFLIFLLPANRPTMEAHNLTPLGYRIVFLSLTLPSILTWLVAFWSYFKLYVYSNIIKESSEGAPFTMLTKGAAWLAWSLPLSAITGIILTGIANKWEVFRPAGIILGNYVNLLLPLIAFTIIGGASRRLISQAGLRLSDFSSRSIMLLFVLAGVSYSFLTFRWFDLTNASSTNNPFYMPLWLTLLTIIIPYLYTWFIGLLAAYELTLYSRNSKGLLYKKAVRYLSLGLVIVIVSSISLQYLTTASPRFGDITFDLRLLAAWVLRLLRCGGFVLITLGAVQLKKIEEV